MRKLRLVLARSLNEKQLLILSNIRGHESVSSILAKLSKESGIPLSSLKLNARQLKSGGLIDYDGRPAIISDFGRFVLNVLNMPDDKE